jgi:hypothetical protein
METLVLERDWFTDLSTSGQLFIGGKFECYTLEDKVRPVKIAGITAIPVGTYSVAISFSPRFGRPMPLLMDVLGFEGVRIHTGNSAEDTDGCILVGVGRTKDHLQGSRIAYDALFPKLEALLLQGPVSLEIKQKERP